MEKTSRLKTFSKGFTLFELLIVLAIFAAIVAFGIPRFRSPQNNIKAVVRQMASLSREVRNLARMKRMTYRIALRMGEGDDAYWVENASGSVLVPSEATLENIKKMDEKDRPPDAFQKTNKPFKGEKKLPSGLYFGSVETVAMKEPATQGTAYVYFSPEGLVERSVIQLTDKDKLTWSLVLNPITGHADVLEIGISLKEANDE
ncbi:MAG: prepilin-type cleavage/methylation domain-containing protein [Bdellovibrio sp. CG10_big_fil_rev_8_21_14_0_10_47_8]|nr:MAG: prepilin-type cleavage/methylation domain-containing protein [Bdellovibrio sp. CG10_big_fil_rev_8_21_14_0_10_47_8]